MTDCFGALAESADAAMLVVTTAIDGQHGGCMVGFHSQCSIEPARYALWLSKANRTYRVALAATWFGVHFLTADDHDLAELFGGSTGDETDKFAAVGWQPGPDGVPLLERCPHRLVARRITLVDDGGDHVCVVVEPVEVADADRFTPLRLTDVADVEPGHPADD